MTTAKKSPAKVTGPTVLPVSPLPKAPVTAPVPKAATTAPIKVPANPPVKKAQEKATPDKKSANKTIVKKVSAKKPLSESFVGSKAVKTAKAVKVVKAVKLEKPKKAKLIRDSFTIPKAEYIVLDDLKQRAAKLTRPVRKSELLRAGIKALAALSDAAFLTALEQVPAIKTGRPANT